MILALLAGLIGGALWAGIAGLLKARTGAHEVIVTIMLNYVAFYLVSWMLRTPGLLQAPGSSNPKTPPMKETAVFPDLLGPQYNLHFGFILVDRRDDPRLVDPQPVEPRLPVPRRRREPQRRARGRHQREEHVHLRHADLGCACWVSPASTRCSAPSPPASAPTSTPASDSTAITVALLGRSTPWGTFAAGVLFGGVQGRRLRDAGLPADPDRHRRRSCSRSSCCSSRRRRWCARSSSCPRPSATGVGARRRARRRSRPRSRRMPTLEEAAK